MTAYTNLDTVQRPATGLVAPAAWGYGVNDDLNFLYGDSGWTTVTLFSGAWADFGNGTGPVGYRKFGPRVALRGAVKSGTINTAAFTLPTGYRPTGNLNFAAASNSAFGLLTVSSAGVVTPLSGSSAWFSLDGIEFDTL